MLRLSSESPGMWNVPIDNAELQKFQKAWAHAVKFGLDIVNYWKLISVVCIEIVGEPEVCCGYRLPCFITGLPFISSLKRACEFVLCTTNARTNIASYCTWQVFSSRRRLYLWGLTNRFYQCKINYVFWHSIMIWNVAMFVLNTFSQLF